MAVVPTDARSLFWVSGEPLFRRVEWQGALEYRSKKFSCSRGVSLGQIRYEHFKSKSEILIRGKSIVNEQLTLGGLYLAAYLVALVPSVPPLCGLVITSLVIINLAFLLLPER